ncbi:sodium-dependent transporter [Maricurvus nonylphenolicus]|uniref:sodium-dependent transporter n=1 Tax=Maricurvus nonylphenolicus TaxID=1008307 RepID=UPI0036F23219
MASREQFSSKTGFIMAAAGSAIGLGNIWGFPTQTASNGGAAFVLVYFVMAFCLAYPALMAELIIGRHACANAVTALQLISNGPRTRALGTGVGLYGVVVASLILSFYAIVAGWMLAFFLDPIAKLLGQAEISQWLTDSSLSRNLTAMIAFMALTVWIISQGITNGIEKWSTRLMPVLLALLVLLIIYVLRQPEAQEGLKVYLLPDFDRIDPSLILNALGQAFFSLSLGVGTMLIYGSYLSRESNLPRLGVMVTVVDSGIAFIAGLLIVPAMYVAQAYGAVIFNEDGSLVAGPQLIFQVLPTLFHSMEGVIGLLVALAFFLLMSIASVTSSISMLEVPVALTTEKYGISRPKATILIGIVIAAISTLILLNFDQLFDAVVTLTTVYSQPLLGALLCIFVGWIWHRDNLLEEIKKGDPNVESTLFWKIWPFYVRFVCPVLILATFVQSLMG